MSDPDWEATRPDRGEPDRVADERTALEQWLDYHRATLAAKCAGLSETELKIRACPPSSLSLLGLVRHITDFGRWWLRMHAGGKDLTLAYDPDWVGIAFDHLDHADAESDIETIWREVDASRAAVADKNLNLVVPSRGDHPSGPGTCGGSSSTWSRSTPCTTATQTCCARRSTARPGTDSVAGKTRR